MRSSHELGSKGSSLRACREELLLWYTFDMTSRLGAVGKLLFIDLLGSVAWFPIWWYTIGLRRLVDFAIRSIRFQAKKYGLAIWIRNFFVPMYGQYDITGRLVSVFMRFVVLIWRSFALAIESVIYAAIICVWAVALPILIALVVTSIAQGILQNQIRSTFG